MNAAELGQALFARRRSVLPDRVVRQRENMVAYGDWTTLAFDGLVEVLDNDGLTPSEHEAATGLVEAGFFGKNSEWFRSALSSR